MGTRVGNHVHVDLGDLEHAAGRVREAYPIGGGYVRDHLFFHAVEPFDASQAMDGATPPLTTTQFYLVRSTAYEGEGRRIDVYDIWKHGDVVVRKVHVGTRWRHYE